MKLIFKWFVNKSIPLLPLIILLLLWQTSSSWCKRNEFLFSSPISVFQELIKGICTGNLLYHTAITGIEAVSGFLIGVIFGSAIGFGLLFSPTIAKYSKYYVVAISAIPIFAIAPLMIIWFGIGMQMKIAMAFLGTVLIALSQAYEGGKNVDKSLLELFELNNSSKIQTFKKLIFPASLNWVLASLKISIGSSLLGAFIGEFIASDKGLGFLMLKASGLYNVSAVLASVICIICLAIIFNVIVSLVENKRRLIIQHFCVPRCLRHN